MAIPFKQIVTSARDVILVTKADLLSEPGPEIVYVNPAFVQLTGYTEKEVIGKNPRILQGEDTNRDTLKLVRHSLEKQEAIRFEILNYSKANVPYWLDCSIIPLHNDKGVVEYFAAVERDLTEYKNTEARLREQASHDPLTGLLNRRAFMEYANAAFQDYKRFQTSMAIAIIDLDNFKQVNDSYGHEFGDKLLQKAVYFIREKLRANDIFARIGGDEFILCFTHINESTLEFICNKLLGSLLASIVIDGVEFHATISLGLTIGNQSDNKIDDVIRRADEALYQAKAAGKNCFRIK
jgi:diguanylate cyclase (GGDEF)-like protein/PAS domain S-box-containing protein